MKTITKAKVVFDDGTEADIAVVRWQADADESAIAVSIQGYVVQSKKETVH